MSDNHEIAIPQPANSEIANAETVAWGSGPAAPPPGPPTKTWQAPAVITAFLVVAGLAAAAGVALSGGTASLAATSADAPPIGVCRTYDAQAALAVSNDSPVVPCTEFHAAQTFSVSDNLPDPGEDYRWTDAELDKSSQGPCGHDAVTKDLGVTVAEYATTRLTVVFFTPTPSQAKAGARWVRCDHVLTDRSRLTTVAGEFKDLLEIPGAFARCNGVSFGIRPTDPTRCSDRPDQTALIGTASSDVLDTRDGIADVRDQCRTIALDSSNVANPSCDVVVPPQGIVRDGFVLCALRADQWDVDRSAWPAERIVDGAGDSVSV